MTSSPGQDIIRLYRKRARRYDLTANLYYLIGFREWAHRKRAVAALDLRRGGTVVEIGCGTGLNFSLLQEAVGPEGRIVGVDLTDAMLAQAGARIERNGWSNVDLVQADAARFRFPEGVDGVLSTFALCLMPDHERVIRNGARALAPGGRWVILDLKMPANSLSRLGPCLVSLARPFGATMEVANRRPWEAMRKHLKNVAVTELFLGMAYLAVGEA
jgi:demethylmenaquinone methyltransferase/2-methoxy-6-polyprenyl-1,4-benzoquinol methylase